MQLKQKIAVITGAGRGIGCAIALAMAKRGAQLALIDRDETLLAEVKDRCVSEGASARAYLANVARESDVQRTFAEIATDQGAIDVLVNNAGITRDALLLSVTDGRVSKRMTLDQWQDVIDVNMTGVFLCGREAAARMVENATPGVIINVSSISRAGNIGQTNYAASKAAVAAMTVVWAKELARYGIRVGAIAPGITDTEMVSAMKPQAREKFLSAVPLGRAARVEEMAEAVLFVAENDYFTGRIIELDGGLRL
jgi:3-oxoacyl-[acyl-carrier protein] reductase